ncbi:Vacuolar protein sorting-associated protein 41, partial [Ascosphaera atra]
MLRNFGRPVHAVALSPNYKRDRTFLSGGTSGSLVLTVGGRIGGRSDATILGSASTRASGWLGSLGLAQSHGKDTVLHDGEGIINAIKWSHSGKFVVWVNEEGIKVLRSNLHLGSAEAEVAWTRISHIDRPRRSDWDDMAGVWKARAEWVNQDTMESNDEMAASGSTVTESP